MSASVVVERVGRGWNLPNMHRTSGPSTTVTVQTPSAEPFVAAAYRALQASGAAWVLLREFVAPEGDRDLTVLIEDGAHAALDAALLDRGYLCVGAHSAGPHRLYVAYDVEQDTWTKIRCVSGIAFGATRELPADVVAALLARRQLDGCVAALAPADAFWARTGLSWSSCCTCGRTCPRR